MLFALAPSTSNSLEAAGGFAWPSGYLGGKGFSRNGLPEFDWSVIFQFKDQQWEPAEKFQGKQKVILHAAVPARSTRHTQAAVHTLWLPENETIFYSFRKMNGAWSCVANSDEVSIPAEYKPLKK